MFRMLLAAALLITVQAAAAQLRNQLQQHPSPYLAMHRDDPVHWQRWGAEALAKARSENKPLFVSSGYFACHWCHVMQQESYRDSRVAELLNTYFIPVKVDRELQPALDEHLISFVQRTRGSAGWPLNVFLTPEGYPLVGLTYAPTDEFLGLLQKLQTVWVRQAGELKQLAQLAAQSEGQVQPLPAEPVLVDQPALHAALVRMALDNGDDLEGGFGRQRRFPMAPQWAVLLKRLQQAPDPQLRQLAELTLDQMAGQGLRDHLGGGFFRYTVDPGWQVPHYEKMLYTQALLVRLYLQAAEVLQRPDYRAVARDTLDFVLADMAGPNGGFIASLSAVDPNGTEGGGYLWQPSQLEQLLAPEELVFARRRWQLHSGGAGENGILPVDGSGQSVSDGREDPELLRRPALEQRVKHKLLQARRARAHPRDTKQLAAWNGLMLSALVDAARAFDAPAYRQAAARLRDFLVQRLWDGKQLLRARGSDGELGRAALEDYAYVAAGLWHWAGLSGSREDAALAKRLAGQAWERFYRAGGWQSTDDLLIPGAAMVPVIADGPLPSPAATLIELSLQQRTSVAVPPQQLQALLLSYPETRRQPLWHATHALLLIQMPPVSASSR